MSYKSILVVLDIDVHAAPLIKFAVDLATRFDAKLIGLSAAEVVVPPLVMEGIAFDGEFLQNQMKNIEGRLADLLGKSQYRNGVGNCTSRLTGILPSNENFVHREVFSIGSGY